MPQPTAHPDDDILVLFVDDELPQMERRDIERHVRGCATCAARVDATRRVLAEVATAYAGDGEIAAVRLDRRHRFERALQETVASQGSLQGRTRDAFVGWQTQALVAAALVLAAVAVPALWSRDASIQMIASATDGLPDRSLTPGAVSTISAAELCSGARPSRVVTVATRDRVLRAYRMEGVHASEYELDALITPELGGTTDAANLWPQRYESPLWTAHVKDELEELLPALVCRGEIELARAQQEIATDWVAAYKRHFKTGVPLRAHLVAPRAEQDELIVLGGTVNEASRAPRSGSRIGAGLWLVSLAR